MNTFNKRAFSCHDLLVPTSAPVTVMNMKLRSMVGGVNETWGAWHWIWGWTGPRAIWVFWRQRKTSCPWQEIISPLDHPQYSLVIIPSQLQSHCSYKNFQQLPKSPTFDVTLQHPAAGFQTAITAHLACINGYNIAAVQTARFVPRHI